MNFFQTNLQHEGNTKIQELNKINNDYKKKIGDIETKFAKLEKINVATNKKVEEKAYELQRNNV